MNRIPKLLSATFAIVALWGLPAALLAADENEGKLLVTPWGVKTLALSVDEIREGREASLENAGPHPLKILVGRDSPNGTRISVYQPSGGQNLGPEMPKGVSGFENGELEDGFYLETAAVDLNGDQKPEVIVAVGDKVAILSAVVFTGGPDGSFHVAGVINGQKAVTVESDGLITAPYGSQGLYGEYQLSADGRLISTADLKAQ